jgi:fructose-1,6-bisphosphatase/inositol monophosphatase family enzyme
LSRSGREAVEVASQAAEEAGSLLLKHVHGQLKLGYKEGRANLVTDIDVAAEKSIMAVLQREYPDFGIISEESPAIATDSPYTWVIDPLDGTNNYVHGVPLFSVVIGLCRGDRALCLTGSRYRWPRGLRRGKAFWVVTWATMLRRERQCWMPSGRSGRSWAV